MLRSGPFLRIFLSVCRPKGSMNLDEVGHVLCSTKDRATEPPKSEPLYDLKTVRPHEEKRIHWGEDNSFFLSVTDPCRFAADLQSAW